MTAQDTPRGSAQIIAFRTARPSATGPGNRRRPMPAGGAVVVSLHDFSNSAKRNPPQAA